MVCVFRLPFFFKDGLEHWNKDVEKGWKKSSDNETKKLLLTKVWNKENLGKEGRKERKRKRRKKQKLWSSPRLLFPLSLYLCVRSFKQAGPTTFFLTSSGENQIKVGSHAPCSHPAYHSKMIGVPRGVSKRRQAGKTVLWSRTWISSTPPIFPFKSRFLLTKRTGNDTYGAVTHFLERITLHGFIHLYNLVLCVISPKGFLSKINGKLLFLFAPPKKTSMFSFWVGYQRGGSLKIAEHDTKRTWNIRISHYVYWVSPSCITSTVRLDI